MATIPRFVNTGADGAGDGTTNNTSGADGAYLSMSSWEANTETGAADDFIVDCCGVTADTTAVTINFATTPNTIIIRGNRSHAAGYYDGNVVISDQHYRLVPGNVTTALLLTEAGTTIDGIQIQAAHTGSFGEAIGINSYTGNTTIKKCRLLDASSTDRGIGNDTSGSYGGNGGIFTIENCLIVGFDQRGIGFSISTHFRPTINIYHNTIYGDGASIGISLTQSDGSEDATANVKGNAVGGNGGDALSISIAGGTVNYADNALENAEGSTDEIVLGTETDAWTSPSNAATADFTVKDSASTLYNAVNPTLVSEDITEFTRDGTNHDVGAFELVVAAGESRPMFRGA